MKPRVYIETSIPSYLTARPSRILLMAAHQQVTADWWSRRHEYELFISRFVQAECQIGDATASAARMAVIDGIPALPVTPQVIELARELARELRLPSRAGADAFHIATAAVHGMNFLLTWNCRHIANAAIQPRIGEICRVAGVVPPVVCTPNELVPRGE